MYLQCFCDGWLVCHEYSDQGNTFANMFSCIAKEYCFSLPCLSLSLPLQLWPLFQKHASNFFSFYTKFHTTFYTKSHQTSIYAYFTPNYWYQNIKLTFIYFYILIHNYKENNRLTKLYYGYNLNAHFYNVSEESIYLYGCVCQRWSKRVLAIVISRDKMIIDRLPLALVCWHCITTCDQDMLPWVWSAQSNGWQRNQRLLSLFRFYIDRS